MTPFLITGLPRSGTAWMAAMFTTDNSICYHEPVTQVPNYDAWLYGLEDNPHKFVGISDSSIPFAADKYQTFFPDARRVVIMRRKEEVIESYRKVLGMNRSEVVRIVDVAYYKLEQYTANYSCLLVPYEKLHDLMENIWDFVFLGEIPFNAERAELMKQLNIQRPLKQKDIIQAYKNFSVCPPRLSEQ